ncbi:MAG: hypothetical protein R3293_06610 [Candidatus Promineifilaceae bacterium]|nr:hypothetical protein [Candidatus Promineifilaceae bacterium]
MTFVIASIVIFLTFIVGALLAWVMKGVDSAVVKTKEELDNEDKAYNPALTLGHRINTQEPPDKQIKQARLESAKAAAAQPRGANMRIAAEGSSGTKTASQGLAEDPWTASKIAQFHGWDGARMGIPAGGVPEGGVAVAAAAPAAAGKIKLVPGKDYPVIEITDDMTPDEKRKARIANSKAKSAAMKAAKAAGVTAAAVATPTAAPATAAPAAPDPAAVGIEPPKLIPISDDMPPDELRKARIANSKAKSAFNKALKAAGIDPKTVEIDDQGHVVMPQSAAPVATAAAPAAAVVAPTQAADGPVDLNALGISPPELVNITDDMPADEVRKARIANSKAKSAFNKALKAAGIDPQTVEIDDQGHVVMPQVAAPTAAAPAPVESPAPAAAAPTQAADGAVDLNALGISPPELVEITDGMSPDEVRQARIANSKAKSAFNKALKAAGIDPKTVDI